jgi:hypothetical protein
MLGPDHRMPLQTAACAPNAVSDKKGGCVCATGYAPTRAGYQVPCSWCAFGYGLEYNSGASKCTPCSRQPWTTVMYQIADCACPTGQVYDTKTSKCGVWQMQGTLCRCLFHHPAACQAAELPGAVCSGRPAPQPQPYCKEPASIEWGAVTCSRQSALLPTCLQPALQEVAAPTAHPVQLVIR